MYNDVALAREIDLIDTLVTGPVAPAVDLELMKLHLGTWTGYDDRLIDGWVEAATQFVEEQTGRQLITCTRELLLDRFPGALWQGNGAAPIFKIELPRPPLQSVVSVQYVDGDGTVQDFTDTGSPAVAQWQVKNAIQTQPTDPHHTRGWIEPLFGQSWPTTRVEGGAIRIRYVAGYGDTDAEVPALLKAAIQYLVGNFEQNRSAEAIKTGFADIPMNVSSILLAFERTARSSVVLR